MGVEWVRLKRENGPFAALLFFPLSLAPIPISCVLTDPTLEREHEAAAASTKQTWRRKPKSVDSSAAPKAYEAKEKDRI